MAVLQRHLQLLALGITQKRMPALCERLRHRGPPKQPLWPLSPCSPAPARGRVCLAEALQAAGLGTVPLSSGDVLQGPGAQRAPGEAGWALEPGTLLLSTLPGFQWVPCCFVKTISYRLGLAKVD